MNAARPIWRRGVVSQQWNQSGAQHEWSADCKTNVLRQAYLVETMMEVIMVCRISTIVVTLAVVSAASQLWLEQAQASQGPGVMPGTASATMQLAMAIAVYGGSALLLVASLIGAARRRKVRN